MPMFFHPERAAGVWGDALAAGAAKRAPELGAARRLREPRARHHRPPRAGAAARASRNLALYIGGMGARGKNFYNDLVAELRLRGRGRA